jgi:hypothetical protein
MNKRSLNPEVLVWIEAYARCELSLDELCRNVRGVVGKRFIHNEKMRLVNVNQVCPHRAVRITPQHIENLLAKRRRGEISERAMVHWASMVLTNDAFYWEPEDADIVADWVNFLFFDFRPQE